MHIIQEEIGLPKIVAVSDNPQETLFSIDPLPAGYGMTLGNSLRRVLLSSLPGTAVIAVKVEGVTHEYTTLPGMRDSVLDFILNLKGIWFNKYNKGREVLVLEKRGEGIVTAGDISANANVEVLNPDYEITYLNGKDAYLRAEIVVEKNVGYSPSKDRLQDENLVGFIHVDALFSPVEKVRYDVSPTRVGENTNLDKLVIEIVTNSSITPHNALKFSANILTSYFSLFDQEEEKVESEFMSDFSKKEEDGLNDEDRETYTPIEILNLSPRTLNALINGEIGSIEQLTKCSSAKLQSLRGFGKKAMDEIVEALKKRNVSLDN